jgi:hypothetical protein
MQAKQKLDLILNQNFRIKPSEAAEVVGDESKSD